MGGCEWEYGCCASYVVDAHNGRNYASEFRRGVERCRCTPMPFPRVLRLFILISVAAWWVMAMLTPWGYFEGNTTSLPVYLFGDSPRTATGFSYNELCSTPSTTNIVSDRCTEWRIARACGAIACYSGVIAMVLGLIAIETTDPRTHVWLKLVPPPALTLLAFVSGIIALSCWTVVCNAGVNSIATGTSTQVHYDISNAGAPGFSLVAAAVTFQSLIACCWCYGSFTAERDFD